MTELIELQDYVDSLIQFFGIDPNAVEVRDEGMPHKRYGLPKNKYAVYIFEYQGRILKIGKAGPKSSARFTSQHYHPSRAKSNLAKSLLADNEMASLLVDLTPDTVGEWIQSNVRRINVLIDVSASIFTLALFEAALQYKYQPKYEGFENQRIIISKPALDALQQ